MSAFAAALARLKVPVPSPARREVLKQLQCSIFETSYNPLMLRTGAKVLRKRLKGPSLVQYYGNPITNYYKIGDKFGMPLNDMQENYRLHMLESRRARGKTTPVKGQGRRAQNKKR